MCLTLANAAAVLDHHNPTHAARGYTRTRHHAGHLAPWRLVAPPRHRQPRRRRAAARTVTEIHRHHSVLTVTDQYGRVCTYPVDAVLPTAVPLTVLSPPWEQPDDHHRHRDPTDGAVTSGAARGGAGHWSLISFFAQGWLLAPPHPLRS